MGQRTPATDGLYRSLDLCVGGAAVDGFLVGIIHHVSLKCSGRTKLEINSIESTRTADWAFRSILSPKARG